MSINIHTVGKALWQSARLFGFNSAELEMVEDFPLLDPHTSANFESGRYWCSLHDRRLAGQGAAPRQFTLKGWLEACRAARRGPRRTFIMMHQFSGASREGDIEYWTSKLCVEEDLRLLIISVDLATDGNWDLAKPVTFALIK